MAVDLASSLLGMSTPTTLDPSNPAGNYGLLGPVSPWQSVGDLGFGLLAASGPSFQPHSFGSMLGQAGQYAATRSDQAIENNLRRAAVLQTVQEMQATQKIQQLFKDNPDIASDPQKMIAALVGTGSKEAIQGLVSVYADPLFAVKKQLEQDQATTAAAAVADTKIKNDAQWQNAYSAGSAAEYLQSKKGGELLAKSPLITQALQSGKSAWEFFGGNSDAVIAALPFLKGTDPADIPKMLTAAQTLATRGALLQPLTGDLSGAGLDVQRDAYRQVQKGAETVAGADKRLALPEPPRYAWSEAPPPAATDQTTLPPPTNALPPATAAPPATATPPPPLPGPGIASSPTAGYGTVPPPPLGGSPGVVQQGLDLARRGLEYFGVPGPAPALPSVPLAPPNVAPAPPAAAAQPTAPTARKVQTLPLDGQGRPVFRSEAEFNRAIQNGRLPRPPAGKQIVVNIGGTLYPWPVTTGTANGNQ